MQQKINTGWGNAVRHCKSIALSQTRADVEILCKVRQKKSNVKTDGKVRHIGMTSDGWQDVRLEPVCTDLHWTRLLGWWNVWKYTRLGQPCLLAHTRAMLYNKRIDAAAGNRNQPSVIKLCQMSKSHPTHDKASYIKLHYFSGGRPECLCEMVALSFNESKISVFLCTCILQSGPL